MLGSIMRCALVVPSLGLVASLASAQADRARFVSSVDSIVSARLTSGPVAGMAVAVIKGRDTLLVKGYGFADVENELPATARHIFRIGSITKQFTAAAIMQLVEQGKVTLDDDITKFLPDFPVQGRMVRIRHLLNHTSGIRSYTSLGPKWQVLWRNDLSHDSLVALFKNEPFDFAPGEKWSYNNSGYYLLGLIIEKVSGKPYAQHLQDVFFTPLGLTSTSYCQTSPIIKRRAHGYDVQGGALVNAAYLSMNQPYAAGSLCSSVGDLAVWTRALFDGRVISAASLRQMTTPGTLTSGAPVPNGYGYGLGVDSVTQHPRVQHGGGINGFISMLSYYPRDTLTVVVLANTSPAPSGEVADNVARLALGLPLRARPAALADLATTPEQRANYVGNYVIALPDGSALPMRIFEESGRLMGHGQGQQPIVLKHQGDGVFGADFDPSLRIIFDPPGGAKAKKFTLRQGGATIEAPRAP